MNGDDDHELLKVLLGAGAVVALVCLGPGSFRADIAGWLNQHRVFVEQPAVPIPGLGGIGLDVARLVILAGLLITAGALIWIALHTRKSDH